jgi:predicted amidophosphoribosyltransferase
MKPFWKKNMDNDNPNDGTLKRALKSIAFPTYACGHCGNPVSQNARICPHCRALLRGVKCGQCGEVYDSNRKQCPNCAASNTPVVSKGCTCCKCRQSLSNSRANSDIDDVARYCIGCGANICVQCIQKLAKSKNGTSYICPKCKKAVSYFELSS